MSERDEQFLEIRIPLRAIDPSVGAESEPLVATRNDLMAQIRQIVATDDEAPPPRRRLDDARGQRLETETLAEIEKPLRDLAREAGEKTRQLLEEAAVRGVAGILAGRQALADEARKEFAAFRSRLYRICENCLPTPSECVKDIVKYSVRTAIVFAAYHLFNSVSS